MKVRKEYVRGGEAVAVTAERLEGDSWRVRIGDRVLEVTAQAIGDGGVRIVAEANGDSESAAIAYGAPAGKQFMVRINGHTHTLALPAGRGKGAAGGDGTIVAPMTGTILEVRCEPGDVVEADQTLVVLSAMKMEHKLTAGIAGVVQDVTALEGATVDQGAALAVVAAAPDEKKSK